MSNSAKEAQSALASIRKQFGQVSDVLSAKEKVFKQDTTGQSEVAPVVEQTTNVVEPKVETAPPATNKTKTEQPAKTAPATSAPAKTAPAKSASAPRAEGKPAGTVSTKIENGREVKTYTDGDGNIKIRKFLDTSPKKPAAPQSRPNNGRPQGGYNNNRNGQGDRQPRNNEGRPPYNKDGQGQSNYNRNNNGQGRPQGQGNNRPTGDRDRKPATTFTPVETFRPQPERQVGNKHKTHDRPDDKRTASKKNMITRDYSRGYDDDRVVRRAKSKKGGISQPIVAQKITHAVVGSSEVSIKLLSEKIGVGVSEIIKQLFKENIFKTINDSIDYDFAAYIAGLYDITLELKEEKSAEDIVTSAGIDDGLEDNTKRPPIVTVMGHVDHGKTSLLDAIRNTSVTAGEAGGITQHIGAYTVYANNQPITFIDTPGHAAFTAMRARGAKVTDVAIIVVAADDGVMPQTIEAINHAKAAGVTIVVAINKMDKPDINMTNILTQLSEHELLSEQWGGDTIMVPVSAKTGMGLSDLLESVLLVTEIKDLKANPDKKAVGTVIESRLDKGRGVVATILVSNGTLNIGDNVIAGLATGKIRAMFDDKGKRVKSAGPSIPVEVLGFSEVPDAGDFMYVADEKLVRKAAEERKNKIKIESTKQSPAVTLDGLFGRINEGQLKTLNIIIKTDVQGSLEALKSSLIKISNDEVRVNPIHGGVGAINETDIMLARASEAIIIGFNVRADANAKSVAEREGVDVRQYTIIYDAVDDITSAMKGLLAPKYEEKILGTVDVREVFKITGVGTVAGCYVTSGKVLRNSKVRVYRNDVIAFDGAIMDLKRFKDEVKEVAAGYECGISIENYGDLKVGDVFEVYLMEEVKQ